MNKSQMVKIEKLLKMYNEVYDNAHYSTHILGYPDISDLQWLLDTIHDFNDSEYCELNFEGMRRANNLYTHLKEKKATK